MSRAGRSQRAAAAISVLRVRYPVAFPPERQSVSPLTRNIDQQLRGDPTLKLTPEQIRLALKYWCNRAAYLRAVRRPGSVRINVDGSVAANVDTRAVSAARQQLAIDQRNVGNRVERVRLQLRLDSASSYRRRRASSFLSRGKSAEDLSVALDISPTAAVRAMSGAQRADRPVKGMLEFVSGTLKAWLANPPTPVLVFLAPEGNGRFKRRRILRRDLPKQALLLSKQPRALNGSWPKVVAASVGDKGPELRLLTDFADRARSGSLLFVLAIDSLKVLRRIGVEPSQASILQMDSQTLCAAWVSQGKMDQYTPPASAPEPMRPRDKRRRRATMLA